jgi:hypothetical protein
MFASGVCIIVKAFSYNQAWAKALQFDFVENDTDIDDIVNYDV